MVIRTTCASKLIRNHVHSIDLSKSSLKSAIKPIMILVIGLAFVATSSTSATITTPTTTTTTTRTIPRNRMATGDALEAMFGRRLGAIYQPDGNSQQLVTSGGAFGNANQPEVASNPMRIHDRNDHYYHQSSSQTDLSQVDQMEEPTYATPPLDQEPVDLERTTSSVDQLDQFGEPDARRRQASSFNHRDNAPNLANDNDEADRSSPDGSLFTMSNHDSQLRAMRDMFERRHLDGNNNNNNNQHRSRNNNRHHINDNRQQSGAPLQSSQELSPISIGLDNVSPFAMPPFQMGGMNDGGGGGGVGSSVQPPLPSMGVHMKSQMSNADNLDGGLEPTLPFGLNPLPHLMGFQSAAFDGPQRGDQSAHSNHHAAAAPQADTEPAGGGSSQSGQKTWPKIFRFTDGRINLSDFEKQKKIRLSSKHNENHIESAPIMFDGRPLKRKSFLILHGGVFPGN